MKQLRKIGVSILATTGLAVPLYLAMPSTAAMAEVVFTNCEGGGSCTADEDQTYEIVLGANVNGNEVGDLDNDGIIDLTTEVSLTFHQAYEVTNDDPTSALYEETMNLWVFSADINVVIDPNVVQEARVSAFGFDTGGICSTAVVAPDPDDPDAPSGCLGEGNTEDSLFGVGDSNGDFDTRSVRSDADYIFGLDPFFLDAPLVGDWMSDVVYENDLTGAFPNQFGNLDVCFTMGNSCQGGQNGGVTASATSMNFTFVLAFAGSLASNPSVALSQFGIRYQSLSSTWYTAWENGDSGTGTRIPEPGSLMLMGMGLMGLGVARRRRQKRTSRKLQKELAA